MNENILFGVLAAILVFSVFTSGVVAHVSDQQRYNDGYDTGQDYAACDYTNCDHGNHGYDTGCPNDKKHTYVFCNGYSQGYSTKWNSLAGETTTQQTQGQAQGDSSVRIDGSHNNVVIAPRQTQEQAASSSTTSNGGEYGK